MPEEKKLNKIQTYALKEANSKIIRAKIELQEMINEVGKELGLPENEKWIISEDFTTAIKQEKKQEPPK